jgi:hypothetical protein
MRLLRHPTPQVSSIHPDPYTRSVELFTRQQQQMTSRHDPQLVVTRHIPVDPYEAWVQQRHAARRAANVDTTYGRGGRFSRNRSAKAPWDAILIKLTPDGPKSHPPC